MADYNSSLPIRSEADVDERVQVKIVDATNPGTQQMEVDTDGNLHAEAHGNDPAGVDRVLRTSEEGHANVSGLYDGTNNTDPANIGLVGHSRSASPADSQQTERITTVENAAGDTRSLDMSLHDEDGEAYSASNPLPVTISESEGAEVVDYNTSASVAKDASVNHDYTVTAATTLLGKLMSVSGSGKLKAELQLEDAPAAGTYTTIMVKFNSTANPNIEMDLRNVVKQVAGANVRVVITNRDQQPQDVYSTLLAVEL